jgi:hypothetical protein
MSQFSVKATFDGADLIKGFNDVKKEVEGLESAGEDAKKSLDQMLQNKNSTTNYKRQLSQITAELTDLSVNFAKLSAEEKKSEFGQAMSQRIDELTSKAQELKGVMDEVSQSLKTPIDMPKADYGDYWSEIQRQSEQTYAKFEGIQKVSAGVASGFAAIQGAAALLGDENENLQKALLKVQAAMAIAQGIGGVKDLLEGFKQLKAAFSFATIETVANTTATSANTAVTTANTAATVANTSANAANSAATTTNTTAIIANSTATAAATKTTGVLSGAVTSLKGAFSGLGKFLAGSGGPVALFAAIVTGAVAVVGNLDKIQRKLNGISKERQAAISVAELNEELTKIASNDMAKATLRLQELAQGFRQLGADTNAQKQYISDCKDELSDLGIEIDDLNDAENVFVTKTDAYITALKKRAMAEAARQKAVEDYKAGLEEEARLEKNLQQVIADNSDGNVDRSFWENLGHAILMGSTAEKAAPVDAIHDLAADFDAEIAAKNIKAAQDALYEARERNKERVDKLYDFAKEQDAEADKLLGGSKKTKPTSKVSGSGSTPTPDVYGEESLRAAELEAQKLQDKLNRMDTTSPEFVNTKKALFEAQDKVEEIKKLMEQPVSTNLADQYDAAQKKINDIVKNYNIGAINEDEALKQIDAINIELQKLGLKPIEVKLKTEAKTLVEQYNDAQKKIDDIAKEYNIGIINEEEAKKQIEAINAELQKLGLKPIEIKLKPNVEKGQWDGYFDKDNDTKTAADSVVKAYNLKLIDKDYAKEAIEAINVDRINANLPPIHLNLDVESVRQGIDQAMQMFDTFGSLGSVISSINSVYESFNNLPKAMDEAENGWERFMVGFEAGMQIMNVFTTILGTINTLLTTFNTIQQISTLLKKKDAAASGEQALADMVSAETSMTKGGAQMFEAATGAGKAVSWLPIVGPVLAVAAIAAIMGVMLGAMSKSKFASGGIVSNASKIGDFNIARVNGGEMILNNRQQANLFNMLDHNRLPQSSISSGEVTFRIQGDTLVGVIDNYNRKRSRI